MSLVNSKIIPLLALSLLLGACTKTVTTAEPVPTPTTGVIRLQNNSFQTLQNVFFSQCSNSVWGADQMPNGVVVPPAGARSFTLEPGCWDVRVVATAGAVAIFGGNVISAGGTTGLSVTNF